MKNFEKGIGSINREMVEIIVSFDTSVEFLHQVSAEQADISDLQIFTSSLLRRIAHVQKFKEKKALHLSRPGEIFLEKYSSFLQCADRGSIGREGRDLGLHIRELTALLKKSPSKRAFSQD